MPLRETKITDERAHKLAVSEFKTMQTLQHQSDAGVLGDAFIRDANEANAFSKLSRYETSIERIGDTTGRPQWPTGSMKPS